MLRDHSIAVVIPAFNEESKIKGTALSIPDYVDTIYIVNDASTDATKAVVEKLTDPRIIPIHHSQNKGVGAAICSGYKAAARDEIDIACVMAGDGQMDPQDLRPLLEPLLDGRADYTKGNRFNDPNILREMPWTRVLGNTILSVATKVSSGYWRVFDSQCGYTAITRHALTTLELDKLFPRYGYPNDLLAHLKEKKMRVLDVPVRAVYGENWSSGISLSTAIHPVGTILVRSWVRRLVNTYVRSP